MKTLFKTKKYPISIEEIQATKVSESSYWIMKNGKEECNRKVNSYESVFETKGEAIEFMLKKRFNEIRSKEDSISRLRKEIDEINKL